MGDPNVPAECVDLEPTELEKELVEKYNNIKQGPPITYGLFGETMNRDIALEIIPEVIELIGDSVQNLHKAFVICPTFVDVHYNDDSLLRCFGEQAFRENNKLVIIGKPNHFYVSLFVDDNNALTLGKSLSREKAIAIENSSSSKFNFNDGYQCDYSGEIKARCLIDSPNGMFDHNQVRRILKNVINNANKELCIARERNHYSDDDCKSLIDALSEAYLKYVEFEKFVKQKGSEEKLEAIEAAKERIRNLLSEIDKSREQCEFAWQKEVAIGCLEVAVDALVDYILKDCYNKSDYDPPPSTLDASWNTTTIEEYIGQQLKEHPSKASEGKKENVEKAKDLMERWKEVRKLALKLNNHSDESNGGEEVLKEARNLAIRFYLSLHQEQDI